MAAARKTALITGAGRNIGRACVLGLAEDGFNIVLNGSQAVVIDGLPDAYRMPQYRVLLKDQKVADVVSFIRSSWGNSAARARTGWVVSTVRGPYCRSPLTSTRPTRSPLLVPIPT